MEIGLFQLENLILTRTGFRFLDIRSALDRNSELPLGLERILSSAESMEASLVPQALQNTDKAAPVVLICLDGQKSAELARQLEASGHNNIYTVNRGVSGLLEELA